MVLIADVEQTNVRFLAKELAIEVAPFAGVVLVGFSDRSERARRWRLSILSRPTVGNARRRGSR